MALAEKNADKIRRLGEKVNGLTPAASNEELTGVLASMKGRLTKLENRVAALEGADPEPAEDAGDEA